MLLSCFNGTIHVFRGWASGDASFVHLRAKGALLVSANFSNGRTRFIQIENTAVSPFQIARISVQSMSKPLGVFPANTSFSQND